MFEGSSEQPAQNFACDDLLPVINTALNFLPLPALTGESTGSNLTLTYILTRLYDSRRTHSRTSRLRGHPGRVLITPAQDHSGPPSDRYECLALQREVERFSL